MPLFDDDQIKEILGKVRGALGLEDEQTLSEALKGVVNDTLNAYDKRKSKERQKTDEELGEKLEGITKTLEALSEKKPTDQPPPKPGEIDLSKVPEGVRQLITHLTTTVDELKGNFERSEEARKKAEDDTKRVAAEQDAATARNKIRDTLLNREAVAADFDPDGLDILVRELEPRVSKNDSGEYVFDTGKKADITNDPILKPLAEGLKSYAGTAIAKKFQRAKPGTSPGTPPGTAPGTPPAGAIPGSEVGSLKPSDIVARHKEGKIDFGQ